MEMCRGSQSVIVESPTVAMLPSDVTTPLGDVSVTSANSAKSLKALVSMPIQRQ